MRDSTSLKQSANKYIKESGHKKQHETRQNSEGGGRGGGRERGGKREAGTVPKFDVVDSRSNKVMPSIAIHRQHKSPIFNFSLHLSPFRPKFPIINHLCTGSFQKIHFYRCYIKSSEKRERPFEQATTKTTLFTNACRNLASDTHARMTHYIYSHPQTHTYTHACAQIYTKSH